MENHLLHKCDYCGKLIACDDPTSYIIDLDEVYCGKCKEILETYHESLRD